MDTITHGITGALIAKAFFSEREGRDATLAVTAGAVFPDCDILVSSFYPQRIDFLRIHRGATHSMAMLPVFALLLGVLMCLWTRERRKWALFSALCAVGLGSHIFLDVITSYGTMVWSPIRDTRVSWDLIFIVDLVSTTIALLPQLIAWVFSNRAKTAWRGVAVWLGFTVAGIVAAKLTALVHVFISVAALAGASLLIGAALCIPKWTENRLQWRSATFSQIGIALMVLYLGLCGIAHREALAQVQRYAERSGIAYDSIAAIPYPPSIFRWAGLIKSPTKVYRGMIDLTEPVSPSYASFPEAPPNPLLQEAERLSDAQTFLWFARFPWVTYRQAENQSIVEIQDIQFYGPRRNGRLPFTYRVEFDGQGRVLSHGLLER